MPLLPARVFATAFAAAYLVLATAGVVSAQSPIDYRVSFPEPEHHWLQVDVTFSDLGPAPLRARMSRSSPGRYAVHEFAKNVFQIEAHDSAGRRLDIARPDADEWRVTGHDGTVRLAYRIYGDHADGTYMSVDTTHAHLNMPATFIWALGLETRPIRITFSVPPGSNWTAGTQLMPTTEVMAFTAPNLQYFMDSPVELAPLVESRFTVPQASGEPAVFRVMTHSDGRQDDVDRLAELIRRVVVEHAAVYDALPRFEPGHYTFLLDYVGWTYPDAMEHRNSTYISQPGLSIRTPEGRLAAMHSISHELAHAWNGERIRPADLEPFDFTRANVSCCLWLVEGFTEYYGPLLLMRAGLAGSLSLGPVVEVMNGPGRTVRSAVEMSQYASFSDAATSIDSDDSSRTFLSYYTYGAAIALGLDLTIRERTGGRLSLDDYMRRLWAEHGAIESAPGLVSQPYTLPGLRDELAALVGDSTFARQFFERYIEGRDVLDYRRLLVLAGYALEPIAPDRGWMGDVTVADYRGGLRVGGDPASGRLDLVPFGTPAYAAGLDAGDVIVSIDGRPATRAVWDSLGRRAPGETVALGIERRDGTRVNTTATLAANPALRVVPMEGAGALTEAQRTFRRAWLGPSSAN